MTTDHTGEHLHVLFQDDHPTLPPVVEPLEPIEVAEDHPLGISEREHWLHRCNLMDRGWTVLGSQHALG
jgi:hypothetical protein